MKRTLLFGALSFLVSEAHAMSLHYVGEVAVKAGTQLEKTVIGGLSGIAYKDGKLWAISDDKGRFAEPRFYEFDLAVNVGKVSLKPRSVYFLSGTPNEGARKPTLDCEGLVRLPSGDFLVSSEGDNNSKPRHKPRVLRIAAVGSWQADLLISEKFIPESLGQQKKGVQNNAAFEGLTGTLDGKFVFAAVEASLVQDFLEGAEDKGDWIRILKFAEKEAQSYQPIAEYAYPVEPLRDTPTGKEVFRGVSEILAVSETKMIVLERGLRLSTGNLWSYSATLYLADLSKATDVARLSRLRDGKFVGVSKVKLLDFEVDLAKDRGAKKVQNFEGLAWGPVLADGRRSLLVMGDNNFSKKEITELVVLSVEGE